MSNRPNSLQRLVVPVVAVGMVLQVGDALSAAALFIRSAGQAETNPLIAQVVRLGGIPAIFWVKAGLVALVMAVIAAVPPRYGLFVAVLLAGAGAIGLASNAQHLDGQIDILAWLDLLHSPSRP